MLESKFARRDWEEILYALESKVEGVENGEYDLTTAEVKQRGSETWRWARHLRRIIAKIDSVAG